MERIACVTRSLHPERTIRGCKEESWEEELSKNRASLMGARACGGILVAWMNDINLNDMGIVRGIITRKGKQMG
jgi:hypothetical protein